MVYLVGYRMGRGYTLTYTNLLGSSSSTIELHPLIVRFLTILQNFPPECHYLMVEEWYCQVMWMPTVSTTVLVFWIVTLACKAALKFTHPIVHCLVALLSLQARVC